MYRTLDIYGWPRIVMRFEGPDLNGTEIIKGYANCTLPVTPGDHDLICHIYRPVKPKLFGFLLGSQKIEENKQVDPVLVAKGKGREVTTVEHMGSIRITVNVSHKNFGVFGVKV